MARGRPHDDLTKAAVLAALLTGQSVTSVASDYHIATKTVRDWRRTEGLEGGDGSPPVPPQKRAEIGELVGEYLRQNLITLAFQQRHFRDPAWLATQSAGELAVLHGVSVDKAIRLLEALQQPESDAGGPGSGSGPPIIEG